MVTNNENDLKKLSDTELHTLVEVVEKAVKPKAKKAKPAKKATTKKKTSKKVKSATLGGNESRIPTAKVIALLKRKDGLTVPELMKTFKGERRINCSRAVLRASRAAQGFKLSSALAARVEGRAGARALVYKLTKK